MLKPLQHNKGVVGLALQQRKRLHPLHAELVAREPLLGGPHVGLSAILLELVESDRP